LLLNKAVLPWYLLQAPAAEDAAKPVLQGVPAALLHSSDPQPAAAGVQQAAAVAPPRTQQLPVALQQQQGLDWQQQRQQHLQQQHQLQQQEQEQEQRRQKMAEQAAALFELHQRKQLQLQLQQRAAAQLLLLEQQRSRTEGDMRRCSVTLHNAAVSMHQAEEAIERYHWHNSLLHEALPLGSNPCSSPAAQAQGSGGGADEQQQQQQQRNHAGQQAGSLTMGQQLQAAAVERLGGLEAIKETAAGAEEAAAAPGAHPAWQPPLPVAAAAHLFTQRQRQQMAEWAGGGEGLSEQPTRVVLP
jgi:hypothetical protein